jgi:arabinofuranan 3-O-arabinosyltransferase
MIFNQHDPSILGIFKRWRLLAYGYTFPVFYGALFFYLYNQGLWLASGNGDPVYHDFTRFWVAGWQALHGETTSLHGQAAFKQVQDSSAGFERSPYSLISYPPTFTLILLPLAMLPYFAAFLTWEIVTLLCCVAVVYLIVRRQEAISLMLASPLTAWNFLIGQNGFLTASLIGVSLVLLERWPVLAGVFLGCLTYKPQFGLLFPVALIAAGQWRAWFSAAITTGFLAIVSAVAFGVDGWAAFPRAIFAEGRETMLANPDWGFMLQTVYGLVLLLHGGTTAAWLTQSLAAFVAAVVVWRVWRSPVRYSLKAATLSVAAFLATPYAFAYDLAALAIPVAFLATDQMRCGVLRGEQTILIALFVLSLAVIPTTGKAPVGAFIVVALLYLILRRAYHEEPVSETSGPTSFQQPSFDRR